MVALWLVIPCRAGEPPATLGGVVRLASGEIAAGARVTLSDRATGWSSEAVSDATGSYRFKDLRPGSYVLVVELAAHAAFERSGILLHAGQVFRQDGVLLPQPATAGDRAPGATDLDSRTASASRPGGDRPGGGSGLHAPAAGPWGSAAAGPEGSPVSELEADSGPARAGLAGAGQFLEHTGLDGTNEFHGSVYHDIGNDVLNARGFFGSKSRARDVNVGAYIGGPVRKNRTYFTYHYELRSVRSGPQSGFANTTPVPSFRRGDFGQLATGREVGIDGLGRAILDGQVYDPASTARADGVPVRDPFPDNAIPLSHPLRSAVASRITRMMVGPQRPGVEFNVQGNAVGAQSWRVSAPSHFARIDHALRQSLRTGLRLSRVSLPSLRNCGGVGGCTFNADPEVKPEKNLAYYGSGVFEDSTTHHLRQHLDWIAGAALFHRTEISYDHFHVKGHALSAGAGWSERLWGPSGNGLLVAEAGFPAMRFVGNTRYSPLGSEWGRSGYQANQVLRASHAMTWIRGRHTITAGGEYRRHGYAYRGWASNVAGNYTFHRRHTGAFDAQGNNLPMTGDPFASFLLGQVDATHFQIPNLPTISERFLSWNVADRFEVSPRLVVGIGLRFDYQSAIRERDDNLSTFDAHVPNPGAGGRLGAMVFAGHGVGRTGTRTLEEPPRDAFGPQVSLAYRVGRGNVIRGAYGIVYASVPHARLDSVNTIGFRFHANAVDLSNGQRPAYYLDRGFPVSNIVLPPALDPAVGNHTSPAAVTPDRATLPRVQRWTLSLQRQVSRRMLASLAYTGIRGSRLTADRRILGPASNANQPSVLGLGPGVLAARVPSNAAREAGVPMPYPGFRRSVAQSLRPFPHMLNIGYRNVPAGNSFYHGLRAQLERRLSDGAHFRARYVWSKLTGMGAGLRQPADGLGLGPQNPIDTHSLERGLSVEDVPHRVLAAFTHPVPLFRSGKPRSGLASRLLGGWALAGIVRVESGTPVNVVMANDLQPFLFNGQKRPDVLSNRVRIQRSGSFDAATDAFFRREAFGDPGPLRFGDASRTMDFVRGFGNVSEDFSLFRDAWFRGKYRVRLETRFGNIFNRTVLCDPNRNWSARSFGLVYSQCNLPRTVHFGLKLDF